MAYETIGIGTTANDGTGDDLRTAGGKINNNFAKAIENSYRRVFAEQMLPYSSDSMYFLQSNLNPSQVASATTDQGVYFRIADFGNEIPAAANAVKFRVAVGSSGSASGTDVVYGMRARWITGTDTEISLSTAELVSLTVDEARTETYVLSEFSDALIIEGTRGTDKSLYIRIYRDADNAADDYDDVTKLTFVDIEFVTV